MHRINDRGRHPNALISFINPIRVFPHTNNNSPDYQYAQSLLNRVAAIVAPLMRRHGLKVTSLEEYHPNREFWGRNWNAGETIELVLKTKSNGQWLPFDVVLRVMLHELSHIRHMSHSAAFWKFLRVLTVEMNELRASGYTGDGFWSHGQRLDSSPPGGICQDIRNSSEIPIDLCGGSWSRLKSQKRQKRRSSKRSQKSKFTGQGEKIGVDEQVRLQLEQGKKSSKVNPRVAKSFRGRELRLQAALARQANSSQDQPEDSVIEISSGSDSEIQQIVEVRQDDNTNVNTKQLMIDELWNVVHNS